MTKKKIPSPLSSSGLFQDEKEARRVLRTEGRLLRECAREVWRLYLSSYTPSVYAEHIHGRKGRRTGYSARSIRLGRLEKIGDDWAIRVNFINDLAYHPSIGGSGEGHAIMLISQGWGKPSPDKIYRFHYYEGFDFLAKVRDLYDSKRDKRVSFEIEWLGNGKYTR